MVFNKQLLWLIWPRQWHPVEGCRAHADCQIAVTWTAHLTGKDFPGRSFITQGFPPKDGLKEVDSFKPHRSDKVTYHTLVITVGSCEVPCNSKLLGRKERQVNGWWCVWLPYSMTSFGEYTITDVSGPSQTLPYLVSPIREGQWALT